MKSHRFLHAALAVMLICGLVSVAQAGTLKVGDAAPALTPSQWVKGEPVTQFEPGKLYVVEFWATWCGPCRQTIPHLTEMQKQNQEVTFIGQSVWENNQADVEPFVKEMGQKMDYRVAMDDVSGGGRGKMAESWMAAADQNGIPTAFVIDKAGKIAWIGHPMALEPVLKKVVAGTFDVAKEAAANNVEKDLGQRMAAALQGKDYEAALAVLDEAEKLHPDAAGPINFQRFQINVTKKDYDAAYQAANKAAEAMNDNAEALNQLAWTIVDDQRVEKRDLDVAMKIAQRADEIEKHENAAVLDTLARVYWEKGDKAKAIETQTKAVEKADDSLKKEIQETLEKYKNGN